MLGLNRESVAIESQWDLGKEPNKVPRKVKTKGGQQERMILAKRGRNSEEIWKSPPVLSFLERGKQTGEFLADLLTLCLPSPPLPFKYFYRCPRCFTNHCHCLPSSFFLPLDICIGCCHLEWLPGISALIFLTLRVHGGPPTTKQKRSQFRLLGISTKKLCSLWIYSWCFTVDNTIFPWVPNSQKPHGMISFSQYSRSRVSMRCETSQTGALANVF